MNYCPHFRNSRCTIFSICIPLQIRYIAKHKFICFLRKITYLEVRSKLSFPPEIENIEIQLYIRIFIQNIESFSIHNRWQLASSEHGTFDTRKFCRKVRSKFRRKFVPISSLITGKRELSDLFSFFDICCRSQYF